MDNDVQAMSAPKDFGGLLLNARFYGTNQPYAPMLALMHALHENVANGLMPQQLMLLEHEPVITLTRQHQMRSIRTSSDAITEHGIALHTADRGGDATFHGPGQLVGYVIIKVNQIEAYIRGLEHALFEALKSLGLSSLHLQPGFTGVWFKDRSAKKTLLKKIVACGVGIKDGVSKHGFAINITIDQRPYVEHIIPCGIKDRGVATLKDAFSQESLEMPDYLAIVRAVAENIAKTFSLTLSWHENLLDL